MLHHEAESFGALSWRAERSGTDGLEQETTETTGSCVTVAMFLVSGVYGAPRCVRRLLGDSLGVSEVKGVGTLVRASVGVVFGTRVGCELAEGRHARTTRPYADTSCAVARCTLQTCSPFTSHRAALQEGTDGVE